MISDMLSGYDHGVADAKDPCRPDCRNVYVCVYAYFLCQHVIYSKSILAS